MKHGIVHKKSGHFAGWPANYGIWSWGDEIVVGFSFGKHRDRGEHMHSIDPDHPVLGMQARSLDGGETWDVIEVPARTPGNKGMSADEHMNDVLGIGNLDGLENAPQPCQGGINFEHPDFALMCSRNGLHEGAQSWFYVSYDRCHSWEGPYSLPDFNKMGVSARTDYIVKSADECTIFISGSKDDGREGRVFSYRLSDGGAKVDFLSAIGDQAPEGFRIMPASIKLDDNRYITALRCQGGADNRKYAWIELYVSDDDGKTWHLLNKPATDIGGNPPAMIQLQDGRLCLVYGYRREPYGIRARISEDEGATWSDEIILRDDAKLRDLGYPRIMQRPDGTVVAIYYYNDASQPERYIASTQWKP